MAGACAACRRSWCAPLLGDLDTLADHLHAGAIALGSIHLFPPEIGAWPRNAG